jgi:hypothetical protein
MVKVLPAPASGELSGKVFSHQMLPGGVGVTNVGGKQPNPVFQHSPGARTAAPLHGTQVNTKVTHKYDVYAF